MGASREPPRSTSDWQSEVLRGGSLEAPVRPAGGSGAGWEEPGGQRMRYLGCQAGLGWVTETRETGKGPELGHRLARDPSGKPSKPSIGKSDEPGVGLFRHDNECG